MDGARLAACSPESGLLNGTNPSVRLLVPRPGGRLVTRAPRWARAEEPASLRATQPRDGQVPGAQDAPVFVRTHPSRSLRSPRVLPPRQRTNVGVGMATSFRTASCWVSRDFPCLKVDWILRVATLISAGLLPGTELTFTCNCVHSSLDYPPRQTEAPLKLTQALVLQKRASW